MRKLAVVSVGLLVACGSLWCIPGVRAEVRWQVASRRDTAEAYEGFLAQHSASRHAEQARIRHEERAWRLAEEQRRPELYRRYLERHGASHRAGEARLRFDDLTFETALSTCEEAPLFAYLQSFPEGRHRQAAVDAVEEIRWEEAKKAGSIAALERFLDTYPSGRFVEPAMVELDEIRWRRIREQDTVEAYEQYLRNPGRTGHFSEAEVAVDALLWQVAENEQSLAAYQAYVHRSPLGTKKRQAQQRIEEIRWASASEDPTPESIREFLSLHGEGEHSSKAVALLDDLLWDQARSSGDKAELRQYLEEQAAGAHRPSALALLEELAWEEALTRDSIWAFEAYLREFENGAHVLEAREASEGTDFRGLLASGAVEVRVSGIDIKHLKVEARVAPGSEGHGEGDQKVTLRIPPGILFESRDPKKQDMLTIAPGRLRVGTEWSSTRVSVACADRSRAIPGPKTEFDLSTTSMKPELLRLSEPLTEDPASYSVSQAALWIVTNDSTYWQLKQLALRSTLNPFGSGNRIISAEDTLRAFEICREAGVEMRSRKIWPDRFEIVDEAGDAAGDVEWLRKPDSAWQAVRWLDERALDDLLASGVSPEPRGPDRKTPLGLAVEEGKTGCVRVLLERGAATNDPHLNRAVKLGHLDIARLLLEAGSDPDGPGNTNPLATAASEGDPRMVALLLASGAAVEGTRWPTPLARAASAGHAGVVEILLEHGASLGGGSPALHAAVKAGRDEVARILIDAGADADMENADSWRPLALGLIYDREAATLVLLEAGADVHFGEALRKPADIAAVCSPSLLQPLFDAGAELTLHSACRLGDVQAVVAFLEEGVPIESTSFGLRPIQLAALASQARVLETLMDRGADFTSGQDGDWPPLAYAARNGWSEGLAILLARGADPEVTVTAEYKSWKPIQLAVRNGHVEAVRAFIDGGADVGVANSKGESLVVIAERYLGSYREPDLSEKLAPMLALLESAGLEIE